MDYLSSGEQVRSLNGQTQTRPILFVLLGPSGSGKSHLITQICRSGKFFYLPTITTRPARKIEDFKISVPDEQYDCLLRDGEFALNSEIFGYRYGTLSRDVQAAMVSDKPVIVDWSIRNVDDLCKMLPLRFVTIYLYPEDLDDLSQSIGSRADKNSKHRYLEAKREVEDFDSGKFSEVPIDWIVPTGPHLRDESYQKVEQILTLVTSSGGISS